MNSSIDGRVSQNGMMAHSANLLRSPGEDEYGTPTYEDFSPHSKVSSPMEDLRARDSRLDSQDCHWSDFFCLNLGTLEFAY